MARFEVDEGRIAGYEAAQRDAARLWPRVRRAGASALRALSWAPWLLLALAGVAVASFVADALGRVVLWFVLLGLPVGWACERFQLRQWRELAAGAGVVAVVGYVALRAFGA
jgi:hypothetical protein